MKVLIVRAAEDAPRTAARLAAAGHQAIVAPVLTIRALDFVLPAGDFDAVLATSAHAFQQVGRLSETTRLPLFVVGARTAEAAAAAGFAAARVVAGNAGELAPAILNDMRPGARVLYLAGRDRKPDLEVALAGRCALTIIETYAADAAAALPPEAVAAIASGAVAVLHYSQRSAAIFLDLAGRVGCDLKNRAIHHVAISDDAAKPLIAAGAPVAVAAQANEDSMIEELARPK